MIRPATHYPRVAHAAAYLFILPILLRPTHHPVLIHHHYRHTVNAIGRTDELLNEWDQREAALVLASMYAPFAGREGDAPAHVVEYAEELRTEALLIFNAEDSGTSQRTD